MPDEIIQDRLQFIIEHAAVIEERVRAIKDEDVILESKDGTLVVDSLITRLQALRENIKRIQAVDPLFFKNKMPLNVNPIVRFRDLASHHYEKLDHTMIIQICKTNVPMVVQAIQTYLNKTL